MSSATWQESPSSNEKPEAALKKARELWQDFGDIPINNDDEIDEPFLDFKVGTERLEIWRWFEEEFDLSVQNDLMYGNQ